MKHEKEGRGIPYQKTEYEFMLEIREEVQKLNSLTRSNIKRKIHKDEILKDTKNFDVVEWKIQRGIRARKSQIDMINKIRKPRIKIKCACGCGGILEDLDKKARRRKFILGHNNKKVKI